MSLGIQIKNWVKKIKKNLTALQIAFSQNLVPWHVKILIAITIGYALSPIDLIPDFIPIIGLLDDLIILPVLIWVIIKLIPQATMDYCRTEAERRPPESKKNWIAAVVIVIIWMSIIVWLFHTYSWKWP